jgi:nicotinamide mononucleotide adenylyltransferase
VCDVVLVLRDCCADRDEDVHEMLMNKVFPRQATVMTRDQWIASLGFIKTEKSKDKDKSKNKELNTQEQHKGTSKTEREQKGHTSDDKFRNVRAPNSNTTNRSNNSTLIVTETSYELTSDTSKS